jgi:hypothetical protein
LPNRAISFATQQKCVIKALVEPDEHHFLAKLTDDASHTQIFVNRPVEPINGFSLLWQNLWHDSAMSNDKGHKISSFSANSVNPSVNLPANTLLIVSLVFALPGAILSVFLLKDRWKPRT